MSTLWQSRNLWVAAYRRCHLEEMDSVPQPSLVGFGDGNSEIQTHSDRLTAGEPVSSSYHECPGSKWYVIYSQMWFSPSMQAVTPGTHSHDSGHLANSVSNFNRIFLCGTCLHRLDNCTQVWGPGVLFYFIFLLLSKYNTSNHSLSLLWSNLAILSVLIHYAPFCCSQLILSLEFCIMNL